MTSDDYKSVDTVRNALGSIARLGRAAAVHLALACQRPSGSTINGDLKNNIQMGVLLGGFDDGALDKIKRVINYRKKRNSYLQICG